MTHYEKFMQERAGQNAGPTTTPKDEQFTSILGHHGTLSEFPELGPIPDILPTLGLSDVVVFPGMVVPLLVETPGSIKLIDDVVAGDRMLAVVLQRRPEIEEPAAQDLFEHGCAARVLKMLKFPDNTVRILVEGLRRIRIKQCDTMSPYLRFRIELLEDIMENSVELSALMHSTQQQFTEYLKLSPSVSEQIRIAAQNTDDPSHFADLVAVSMSLKLEDRQSLLETIDVLERLRRLQPLIEHETEVVALSTKLQAEVKERFTKRDRELFLREQIRAIQTELGEPEIPITAQPAIHDSPIIKESLERFRKDHPNPTKVCFLMMKFGKTKAHTAIVTSIRNALDSYGFKALRADDKEYHEDLFPNVQTYMHGCGFAIAVLERIEAEEFNPNVSLEVGYMLAHRKPVLLLKDSSLKQLHTDLVGKLYRSFDFLSPDQTIPPQLKSWLEDKGLI